MMDAETMQQPPKRRLTPDLVLESAWTIVESGGVEALTMRRLGSELGVVPMAIYNHFPDREALLNAIAESALGRIALQPRRGSWRTRLRSLINAVHALGTQHPNIYALVMSRPSKPKASVALMSEGLDALRQAGLKEQEAVRFYHLFLILIHGFPFWKASLEHNCNLSQPDLAALTPAQVKDWQSVNAISATEQFDKSVEMILDLIAARTAKSR